MRKRQGLCDGGGEQRTGDSGGEQQIGGDKAISCGKMMSTDLE